MKKATMTIEFEIEVPDRIDLEVLTADIDIEEMKICDALGRIPDSKVAGYTTVAVDEVE
jgi:hypothetical protein